MAHFKNYNISLTRKLRGQISKNIWKPTCNLSDIDHQNFKNKLYEIFGHLCLPKYNFKCINLNGFKFTMATLCNLEISKSF